MNPMNSPIVAVGAALAEIRKFGEIAKQFPAKPASPDAAAKSELMANLTLALRHVEDAQSRLNRAFHALAELSPEKNVDGLPIVPA